MKISLLEPLGVPAQTIEELAAPFIQAGHTFTYYDTKTTDPKELAARSAGCDIVIIANNPYPDEVVRATPSLKMLAVAFTGFDHVGLEACRQQKVTLCNAAGYSNEPVAELCVGMAISLLRNMVACDRATRTGGTLAGLMGSELGTKTVGIVGTGRIGVMTGKLFKAFGCRVLGYSRHDHPEARQAGIEQVPLEVLLAESDIVSLHTPLNDSTRGFFGREKIFAMKPGALFINCARGPIVDNAALAEALNAGHLAGAAVDVFDMEPPIPADYPLLQAKNTLLTPHVAFATEESMLRRAHITFDNVSAYLAGAPTNVVQY